MSEPAVTANRVVVLNQHGDNRGDEAALRAMARALGDRLAPSRFTIVHQFADPASTVELAHPAEYMTLRLAPLEYVRLVLYALARRIGLRVHALAGQSGRQIVEAIEEADLVVSAPGGPYFGDRYADHEIVHWLMVWLAHLARRPLGLYAPSCGPFGSRLLNPIRRRGFRWFDRIVLREARSAEMLAAFAGIDATVTIDSALQDEVPATRRADWADDDEQLVVVAVRDPGGTARERHDHAVLRAIETWCAVPTSVVFLPQLHGSSHRDAPYLQGLADQIRGARRVAVAPEDTDSDGQRAIVAAADLVLAGRYHPAVFSVSAATPVLIIAYEHKATGLAETAGIAHWSTTVEELDPAWLAARAQALREQAADVRAHLATVGPQLRDLASQTSAEMAGLVRR